MTQAQTIDDGDPGIVKKVDGRSREARAAKLAAQNADHDVGAAAMPQRSTRSGARQTGVHDPVRQPTRSGRAVVVGRNGHVLTRKRTSTGDIFDIPAELIPPGWEYQWCAVSVIGNKDVLLDQNLMMAENGWRPVPAERYPGRFMPEGQKGNIVRGGQMLMERPKELCDEARSDDIRAAKQLISDRNESLKLSGVKNSLPDGFEMKSNRYRGTGGDVRLTIDRGLDIPVPQHTLAESGE